MKNLLPAAVFLCAVLNSTISEIYAQKRTIVRPVETDEVLYNPGIGFTTFQMFNGDNLPFYDVINESDIKLFGKNDIVENRNYPPATLAYFRLQWQFMEPEEGKYRWGFIDSLLEIAARKKQKITLRISPYKGRPVDDVPQWYRQMVGPQRTWDDYKWAVDPENPLYAKYFGRMIRELGRRYDGHPWLEHVDLAIVGAAGEGGGTEKLTDVTMRNLVDPYLESFTKTQLIALLHGQKQIKYIMENAKVPVGWRQDCLGDLGFWAEEQEGWTHMFDYYPQTILEYNMQDAWKTAHVSFEICGFFKTWDIDEKYSEKQVQYIIDQSLKWHMSSFNGKSSDVPDRWKPMMDDWLKKMGYRFVLRRFSYPAENRISSKLDIETWWENKGVAPIYGNYKLAVRLQNATNSEIFITDADMRKWLPGDAVFNFSIFPQQLSAGEYTIQVSVIDPHSLQPAVQLAIEGKEKDGWYSVGKINLMRN